MRRTKAEATGGLRSAARDAAVTWLLATLVAGCGPRREAGGRTAPSGAMAARSRTRPPSGREAPGEVLEIKLRSEGLPGVPVAAPAARELDLLARARAAGLEGAPDPATLRLRRRRPDGRLEPVASQWSPAPRSRPAERHLLPGTPGTVSWLGERRATHPPSDHARGVLRFRTGAGARRTGRWELRVRVLREGRLVRQPYPPFSLRVFGPGGRSAPIPRPRLRVRPVRPLDGALEVHEADAPVATYRTGPPLAGGAPDSGALRRPCVWPLRGPSRRNLVGFGKPHDPTGSHDHHYGLWVACAEVDGTDFWSERGGVIFHEAVEVVEEGPLLTRIAQRLRWRRGGEDRLLETRTTTFHAASEGVRLVDVALELRPPGSSAVRLGPTPFGLLGVRVAPELSVFDGGGTIVNARGDRGERGAHLRRARWIDLSAPGGPGIAVLDHPANPRHPVEWHCRNDGWAGAAVLREGAIRVEPGRPLRLRYRLVLHRAPPGAAALDAHWAAWAAEATGYDPFPAGER